MTAALQNYHVRMQRVLDHIDRHLDGDLDLTALSGVAAFSKYHSTGSSQQPSGCRCIATSSLLA